MIIKKWVLMIPLLCVNLSGSIAGKKIARRTMTCQSVTYKMVQNSSRITGRVYQFQMAVFVPQLKIKRVWFGDTPVPCEVYLMPGRIHVDSCMKAGLYLVEANRDLYKNFSSQYDSLEVSKNFHPKRSFQGEAMIIYDWKGLESSYIVTRKPIKTKMNTR